MLCMMVGMIISHEQLRQHHGTIPEADQDVGDAISFVKLVKVLEKVGI